MQVDRAGVDLERRAGGADLLDRPAALGIAQRHRVAIGAADVDLRGRVLAGRGGAAIGQLRQLAVAQQPVAQRREGRPEPERVGIVQRQLRHGAAQLVGQNVGVFQRHAGVLVRPGEKLLGVAHIELIERVILRHQRGQAVALAAPAAAGLLPRAGDRAGESGDQHRIHPADIHAQLQRIGADQAKQLAVA